MARTADVVQEDWLDLESIFLGRTIHVHSLSPLHLPSSSSSSSSRSKGSRLTSSDLDAFANQLQIHLSARFNESYLTTSTSLKGVSGSSSTSSKNDNTIRDVRASFITDPPKLCRPRKDTPAPFAVEIQINQPHPTANNPDARRLETAHLVFFSTSTRQTETHYPLLLWKASLTGRSAVGQTEGQDAGLIDGAAAAAAAQTLNARLLTTYTISFVNAYFDCRLCILAPLHGVRGVNLESIAQSVISHASSLSSKPSNLSPFLANNPMEVTFALPDDQDLQDGDEKSHIQVVVGPAPNLNTISLTIPWAILDELLNNRDASPDSPQQVHHIFDLLRQYLSTHTSMQLSKMSLTRVGIGSVFLGAPTSTVSASGKASSGEVRLKIQKEREEGQGSQVDLIVIILSQLVKIAEEEEW